MGPETESSWERAPHVFESVLLSSEELLKLLDKHRAETERALKQLGQLETMYPDFFAKLHEKYPKINDIIFKLKLLGQATAVIDNPQVLAEKIREYRFLATELNHAIKATNRHIEEERDSALAGAGEINDFNLEGYEFSDSEKAEMKAVAQELWEEMFPTNTYVNQFAMGLKSKVWGQNITSIADDEKWMLAPANGIEMTLRGVVDLLNPETYRKMKESVSYISSMSYEDWKDAMEMMNFAVENLPSESRTSALISMICGLAFFGGGIGTISSKLSKLSCGKKLEKILKTSKMLYTAERGMLMAQPLPAYLLGKVAIDFDRN